MISLHCLSILYARFVMAFTVDPLSQLYLLPSQLTGTLLLRIPDVLWMGSFTLMVIVWVGIVKAAKGNTMTVKVLHGPLFRLYVLDCSLPALPLR